MLMSPLSVGMKKLPSVRGMRFTQDCIGFVRYAYFKAGVDLLKASGNQGRGVRAIHKGLKENGFVFDAKTAKPGDIIFFEAS